MRKIIRQQLIFSGRVQGVGFRYTAKYSAQRCNVSGWVYNEFDGTVVMEAQGTESSINEMIHLIERAPFIEIDRIEKKEIAIKEWERSFEIR